MATVQDEAGLAVLDETGAPIEDGLAAAPRTAEDYARALLALLPPGAAWPKEGGSVQGTLVAALAGSAARLDERAIELLSDSPAQGELIEMLPEWEATLGLPDACSGVLPTLALRQAAVRVRIGAQGGQSIARMLAIAASLGITAQVQEFRPVWGGDTVPAVVYSEAWSHVWRMVSPASTPDFARQALECAVRRIDPAHTRVLFAYL